MADGVHKYPTDPTLTTGAAGTADGNAGVNLTEGVTQVNAINNAMRGLIGDIGSWRDDVSGVNTTTGSANTYVLATTSGLTSLQDGLTLTFLINVTNTGASTLNVDTLGAKKLLASGAALVAGNLVAGQPVTVVYDASADSAAGAWLVANPIGSYTSDDIGNDSGVTGATVTAALDQLAPLASPTFTGTPAAPTAAADTNTTQIATTAYVQTELGDYAPLASPALTGNPTAPTQSSGDNSTKIATTAYVDANTGGGLPSAVIEDQKAAGTAGGTFTSGAWRTRTLNTVSHDPGSVVTLSSNEFSFSSDGWIEWAAPAYSTNRHQTRLYNVTDAVVVKSGSSAFADTTYRGMSYSVGGEEVVSGKTYRLEHRSFQTQSTNGLGIECDFGEAEVYARVKFWSS